MISEPATHYENLSEPSYKLLVQSVTDLAIFMLDLEGRIVSWNAGARRIKGYSAEEVLHQHLSIFYTEEDRADNKPQRLLDRVRSKGNAHDEGWRLRKDGSRFWAQVALELVRDTDGTPVGFAKITRDMTQSHEAALHLENMRAQLFQAQKLEALGQLTGGLAHDFNNLLTIIISASTLARTTKNPERLGELLENIHQAGLRGSQLTQHLLTFARRRNPTPQVIELCEVLPAARAFLAQALPKEISLKLELEEPLYPVELDPSQLEMSLLNLILNARDALHGAGEIRLHAENREMQGEWDNLHGPCVLISVSDTGMGIAPDDLARIFEPFFTTKGFERGTGLGLSQVYGFAKGLHGAVQVNSELDHGTTVTLYLPAAGRSNEKHANST
nr:PAS domain S-box protein [uncultured Pseudomonas sp.]